MEGCNARAIIHLPKVDELVFRTNRRYGEVFTEDLDGRTKKFNMYSRHAYAVSSGDITPFLKHMKMLFPVESDREVLYDFLAYQIQNPGKKPRWSIFIQSTQGAGKNVIKHLMRYVFSDRHVKVPSADKIANGNSNFNGWLPYTLFTVVDEINVSNRGKVMEKLKPWISESRNESESKGVDATDVESPTNWAFFSNHKNGISISRTERRYAPFFSALQTDEDLKRVGWDGEYFKTFYGWLGVENGTDRLTGGAACGLAAVAGWLRSRDVRNFPVRAPHTSS